MKKYYPVLLCCLFIYMFLIGIFSVRAFSGDSKDLSEYIRIYIEENYDITERYPIYSLVRERVKEKITTIGVSKASERQYLKDLMFYNKTNIIKLVDFITSKEGSLVRFAKWKQNIINDMKDYELTQRNLNNIDSSIIYITENNEFTKEGEIYKMNLGNIFPIQENELVLYKKNPGNIIYKNGFGYLYGENIQIEKKISFEEIVTEGDYKFLFYNNSFFQEGDELYTYEYDEYFNINSNYGVYESEFINAGKTYEDAIFLRLQDGKNNVVFSPKKKKIISTTVFDSITDNIHDLINKSIIDVLRSENDYQNEITNIFNLGKSITQGLDNDDDKILAIYDWMVKNIDYPDTYDITDYKIFSGLEAYNNKSALCEGQIYLMYYLLKSAEIDNVIILNGYVIDSPDFPNVGHAWIQIGDYFYDPSFESQYKSDFRDYRYYKLPYDLAYTNRYNLRDIPDSLLESQSPENIKKEIQRGRFELTKKYTQSGEYAILAQAYLQKDLNLKATDTINIENISKKIVSYDIKIKNGELQSDTNIFKTQIEYYPIKKKDEDISNILEEIKYKLDGYAILNIYENNLLVGYGLTPSLK